MAPPQSPPAGLHRLPDDILSIIVDVAMGSELEIEDAMFGGPEKRRSVELLQRRVASVCRDLRNQMNSIPAMWTRVYVVFLDHGPYMDTQLGFLRQQTQRAASTPLHFYLSATPNCNCDSFEPTLQWLSGMLSHAQSLALWTARQSERMDATSPSIVLLNSARRLQRLSFNSAKSLLSLSTENPALANTLTNFRVCGVSPTSVGAAHYRAVKTVELICCPFQTEQLLSIAQWWPQLETLNLSLSASLTDLRAITAPHLLQVEERNSLPVEPAPRPTLRFLTLLEIKGSPSERFYEQAVFGRSGFTAPTPGPNQSWVTPVPIQVAPPAPVNHVPLYLPALRTLRTSVTRTFAPNTFETFFSEVAPGITDLTFTYGHPHDGLMMGVGRFASQVLPHVPHLRQLAFEELWFHMNEFPTWTANGMAHRLDLLRFYDCRFQRGAGEELVATLAQEATGQTGAWKVKRAEVLQIEKAEFTLPIHVIEGLRGLASHVEYTDLDDF